MAACDFPALLLLRNSARGPASAWAGPRFRLRRGMEITRSSACFPQTPIPCPPSPPSELGPHLVCLAGARDKSVPPGITSSENRCCWWDLSLCKACTLGIHAFLFTAHLLRPTSFHSCILRGLTPLSSHPWRRCPLWSLHTCPSSPMPWKLFRTFLPSP